MFLLLWAQPNKKPEDREPRGFCLHRTVSWPEWGRERDDMDRRKWDGRQGGKVLAGMKGKCKINK